MLMLTAYNIPMHRSHHRLHIYRSCDIQWQWCSL